MGATAKTTAKTTAKKKLGGERDVTGPEDIDWSRVKVIGRGLKKGRRFSLRALRTVLGKTQAEIAETAEMAQGDVSRLEAQEDMKLSTLTRYAAALGGRAEVTIAVGGRRYLIDV